MIDLFCECEENDITSYADDTTPYSCATDMPSTVISELEVKLLKSQKMSIGLAIII